MHWWVCVRTYALTRRGEGNLPAVPLTPQALPRDFAIRTPFGKRTRQSSSRSSGTAAGTVDGPGTERSSHGTHGRVGMAGQNLPRRLDRRRQAADCPGHRARHRARRSAGSDGRRPADVAAAQVAAAAAAGVGRARTPSGPPILRKAADLWLASAAEIEPWVIGNGKIRRHAVRDARGHRGNLPAATLPSRPYGELLPSEQPRLSFAERVPVGVVGVIAPFDFPQILSIRSVAPALALGNAVILKPDPRTSVCGGVGAGPDPRGGRPARRAAARAAGRGRRGRGPDHRAAGAGHLVHRLHRRGRRGRELAGAAPQARAPGAGRQLRAHRAGRRRPRPGRLRRAPGARSCIRGRSA